MKKIYLLTLIISIIFIGCSKNDTGTEEITQDPTVIIPEKKKSVSLVTFANAKMIITLSTNEKVTFDIPLGLQALQGPQQVTGAAAAYIKTISYNESSSILTITLLDGTVSEFRIVTGTTGALSAIMLSETTGNIYVTEINMGAVPLVKINYNANYNVTHAIISSVMNGQIVKESELTKQYTNDIFTGAQVTRYATQNETKFTTEYLDNYKLITIATDNGAYYTELAAPLYKLYVRQYGSGNSWTYRVFDIAIMKTYTSIVYPYTFYEAQSPTTVYHFCKAYETSSVSGGVTTYNVWYAADFKYTKTGSVSIGDILNKQNVKFTYGTNGKIEKVFQLADDGVTESQYNHLFYNTNGYIIKAETYTKINGNWQKESTYTTGEYNSDNLLTSVKQFFGDGSSREVYKAVYDNNGNPLEIYTWNGAVYSNVFDPFTNPTDPNNSIILIPEGLQLVAKIEYDYKTKNFLGNTIGAFVPELQSFQIVNAPIKISSTQSYSYMWLKYENFNEFGYPNTIVANAYSNDLNNYSFALNLGVKYIKKP